MKKLLFLFCLLSWSVLHAQKTINRPPFIAKATETIEIAAIHLSDTATVVDVDAKFIPKNWIRIAPATCLVADNGERYQVRQGVGIELGQEFWMPESGEATFSLIFPPLPASVKSFDFVEGEGERDFNLFGISLIGKLPKLQLPKDLGKAGKATAVALPTPEIKEGTAIISGRILDYKPSFRMKVELHSADFLSAYGQKNTELKLDEAGNFHTEMPVSHPSVAYLSVGGSVISFLLSPSGETKITVNLREMTRASSRLRKDAKPEGKKVYFEGLNAGLNTEMNSGLEIPLCSVELKDLYDMNPDQYKAYCMQKYEEADKAIHANKKISKAYAELLTVLNKDALYGLLCGYDYQLLQAYAQQKGLSVRDASKEYRSPEPSNDYFDFLSEFGYINSPKSVYCFNYPSRVVNTGYISLPSVKRGDIFDYLLNSPKVAPKDKETMKKYRDNPSSYDSSVMKELRNRYDALFQEFGRQGMEANRKAVEELIGSQGIYYDVQKAMQCVSKLEDFTPLSEDDFAALHAIENSYFLNRLTAMNTELLRRIEENKSKRGFTVRTLAADVKDDELFEAMVAPFKGKVVLVDFWATWCGPCKMAMKMMKPMKEELIDKDIVYVFIAGENSPETTWNNMIPDIHGEHYRLTNAQWAAICNKFEVRGVPTYLVLDREGKQTYRSVGFPGTDAVKGELLKALNSSAD